MKIVVIAGLVASMGGVLVLFRYGMPYRIESKGQSYLLIEGTDKAAIAQDKQYRLLGQLGLAAVLIGTCLQIVGVILS